MTKERLQVLSAANGRASLSRVSLMTLQYISRYRYIVESVVSPIALSKLSCLYLNIYLRSIVQKTILTLDFGRLIEVRRIK